MKFSIKSVLRFLFPEIQIVDAVKQEGFIAKKAKATATMNTTNNTIVGNTVLQSNTAPNSRVNSNKLSAPKAETTYLSVLCGFFGGGDMNGIKLLVTEVAVRIIYGLVLIVNVFAFVKVVLPKYKLAFADEAQ